MRVSVFLAVLTNTLLPLLTYGLPIKEHVLSEESGTWNRTIRSQSGKILIGKCPDGITTGKHIVTIKEGHPRHHVVGLVKSEVIEMDIVNGFVGSLDQETLEGIQARSEVSSITEECFMSTASTTLHTMTETNAPWGLARLTSDRRLTFTPATRTDLSYTYYSAGACADVYIVDSGINFNHLSFQGRASLGATFGTYGTNALIDEIGHGTHVAGIIGSSVFGVAKGATLIGVKVLGKTTKIVLGDILQGLNWILEHSKTRNRPSIVNLSLSADGSHPEFDRAVDVLIKRGIHVIVAAGNLNKDSYNTSPATVPSTITVGSSTINDERAPTSNYGAIVDLFAPGEKIMSVGIGSNTATAVRSGTSMAVPHVTGLAAYFICLQQYPPTPLSLQDTLKRYALVGVLSGIPVGTPNRLAHIPSKL